MKTSLKVGLMLVLLCMVSCTVGQIDPFENIIWKDGVLYKFDKDWEPVHEREINISAMPDEFELGFRTPIGIEQVEVLEGKKASVVLLDSLIRDPSSGEIQNYFVTGGLDERMYLQRLKIIPNGENHIKLEFHYLYWHTPNTCTCDLVRHQ